MFVYHVHFWYDMSVLQVFPFILNYLHAANIGRTKTCTSVNELNLMDRKRDLQSNRLGWLYHYIYIFYIKLAVRILIQSYLNYS